MMKYIISLLEQFVRQGCPCLFRSLTGLYCPGCGGTRAVMFLMQGNIGKSLWYHPLVGYMALTMGLELGNWFLRKRRKGRGGARLLGHYEMDVYVGIGIIVVNWAVKNWALLWLGIRLIP